MKRNPEYYFGFDDLILIEIKTICFVSKGIEENKESQSLMIKLFLGL